ncbi:MAG TPA: hypothetical protein PLO55_11070 [Thermotogota bacterium]|nr:hypothetical protein [Thermotogota bacterium]
MFLDVLYPDLDSTGLFLLIWSKGDSKESRWFQSAKEAEDYARGLSNADVYFGLGLSGKECGRFNRCEANEVKAIPGFWADIDFIQGDGHEKKNLPGSFDDALKIIPESHKPSIIVHSGGGLHCYWLFNELLVFDKSEERDNAARLLRDFQNHLRDKARSFGWDMDKTHDLSRVLRMPGTKNLKYNSEVWIYRTADQRYNPSDFEMFLSEDEAEPLSGKSIVDKGSIDMGTPFPYEKFYVLQSNIDKFKTSWEHKRRAQDQSQSAYDMSLATFASDAGWTPSEIAVMLYENRKKYSPMTLDKHSWPDYYARTISNAMKPASVEEPPVNIDIENTSKEAILKDVSEALKLSVSDFVKITTTPPTYQITVGGNAIDIGRIDNLLNQRKFQAQIIDAIGLYPATIKKTKSTPGWDGIVQSLITARREADPGRENTRIGETMSWISTYLSNVSVASDEQFVDHETPLSSHEEIWIPSASFRKWVRAQKFSSLEKDDYGKRMLEIGCTTKRITRGGQTFQIWILGQNDYREFFNQ